MQVLIKGLRFIENILQVLSCIGIFAMMLLISFDTIGRYAFNKPIHGAYEITELLLMILVIFLALSHCYRSGDHIRIDFLYGRLKGAPKMIVDLFTLIASASIFFLIAYQGWILTYEAIIHSESTFGVIQMPLVLSYVWIPIGAGVLGMRLLIDAIHRITSRNEQSYDGNYQKEDAVDII